MEIISETILRRATYLSLQDFPTSAAPKPINPKSLSPHTKINLLIKIFFY